MPPLGFDVAPEGGRLVVNKAEAEVVRAIFQLYVESPSLVKVAQELNRRGWGRKSWTTRTGTKREGKPWNRVSLGRVLTNAVYVGKITLGDQTFDGEHDAIVPKKLFDYVQRLMNENRSNGGSSQRNRHGALLRGLLRCSACDSAMVFAPARARGTLHRYYRCSRAMKSGGSTCPTKSVSADRIEQFVIDQIRRIGADPELQQETFQQAVAQIAAQRRGLKAEAKRLAKRITAARQSVEKLVHTLPGMEGEARRAITDQLEKEQEQLRILETRLAEVRAQVEALATQDIDEAAVAAALQDFNELWSVLLTPEKERVLKLLIDRVRYDGGTGKLHIDWRLAGFAELAEEVSGA